MSESAPPVTSSRSAGSKPPAAVPTAVPILGAVSMLFAMLTICGGGVRFVRPETVLGADAISPVFDIAAARTAFYLGVVSWMAVGVLLAVAGAGLLLGRRWGRTLGLVWAWIDVAVAVLLMFHSVAVVAPALDESHLSYVEIFWTALTGPLAGCCPTVWAIVLLAALYGDSITAWARGAP